MKKRETVLVGKVRREVVCSWCGTNRRFRPRCARGPFCATEAQMWDGEAAREVVGVA